MRTYRSQRMQRAFFRARQHEVFESLLADVGREIGLNNPRVTKSSELALDYSLRAGFEEEVVANFFCSVSGEVNGTHITTNSPIFEKDYLENTIAGILSRYDHTDTLISSGPFKLVNSPK